MNRQKSEAEKLEKRERIAEQDDRFQAMYARAKADPARVLALVAVNLDDLAIIEEMTCEKLSDHCQLPISKAHPPNPEPSTDFELSASQKYKLAVMANRGKIVAGIIATIATITAIMLHGVGY